MDSNKCIHCMQGEPTICFNCYRVGVLMAEGEFSTRLLYLENKIEELIGLLKES